MSVALTLTLDRPAFDLQDVFARVRNPRGLLGVLGREAANATRANFRQLTEQGNRFDAPSTGYWEGAAQSTASTVISDNAVVVWTNQVGVRLHYLGGDVRPTLKKWLTIPAIAAAHGKRATEFQKLWLMKKNGQPIALARTIPDTKPPKFEIVFWLRKHTKHLPDRTVLPSPSDLADRLRGRAAAYLRNQLAREGGAE